MDEIESANAPEEEPRIETEESPAEPEAEAVPIGIARIREEWKRAGLVESVEKAPAPPEEVEPVVFPEVDGGAGVGDYTIEAEALAARLGLSHDAVERLLSSGEIDSIRVQSAEGEPRRLVSESSLARFQQDSAMDPDAIKHAAKAYADQSVAAAIEDLRSEIDELRSTQGKVLQQMKDMLLLEVRNLKEQDRDLTSFVYELAEEIRDALPKKKRR